MQKKYDSREAVARCEGFFTRHFFEKSINSALRSEGLSKVGAGLIGIKKMALIGCRFAYGGFISAISIDVIPKDQMSARQSYPIS